MDLAFRVLFHRFQIIFDRIRLTFSVTIGTIKINIKCITAVSTVNIPKPRRSCSWTYKINKLLVSPSERLNNIILERTIEYNTTSASKFHGKIIQRYLWDREHMERKTKVHMAYSLLTCSSQAITCVSYGTSFLAATCGLCRDMPLQKLSGVAIFASLQECVFSSL